jgi:aspartate/methionine/tyrosine aminotransferase
MSVNFFYNCRKRLEKMFPIFKLEQYFEKYEFHARYLLCSSDNESLSLKELLEMADDETLYLWEHLNLGYTEVSGHPLLKREIAKLYQNVPLKGIGTFSGAEEAIFALMQVIVRPKDHVIVPAPCYQSLSTIPKEFGAEVTVVPMRERGGGWVFNVEELIEAIRPGTRLIVINFPHNPTSVHIDAETLEKIVEAARSVNAYLFSDEVYRFSELRGSPLPPAADLYERGVSLGVLSKTLGLAGTRIGWLATQDEEILRSCLDLKLYLTICNSAPSEILGIIALRAKERIIERNLSIIRRNLDLLDRFFERHSKIFSWKRPIAGSTAFPKLIPSLPISTFTEELVEKEGVMLLPGTVYDFPGNHFRLGYGRKNLPEALERLDRYVKHRFHDRRED